VAQIKAQQLIANMGMRIKQAEFVRQATELVVECRRVLSWSYARAFFLDLESTAIREAAISAAAAAVSFSPAVAAAAQAAPFMDEDADNDDQEEEEEHKTIKTPPSSDTNKNNDKEKGSHFYARLFLFGLVGWSILFASHSRAKFGLFAWSKGALCSIGSSGDQADVGLLFFASPNACITLLSKDAFFSSQPCSSRGEGASHKLAHRDKVAQRERRKKIKHHVSST
jgi:hypothetical protein